MIKAFVIIVALALGGLVYSQRSQISDCVDQAKLMESLEGDQAQCTILGYDFQLDIP